LPQLYYDRNQPTETAIRYLNTYKPALIRKIPPHYIVPQSWHRVIERLLWNGVRMSRLPKDTLLEVEAHSIVNYRSYSEAYEGHHKNHGTTVNSRTVSIRFQKGDYLIDTRQPARRYLAEMLEPEGDDSFFAWNFFDPVLQQKEGYSDYRWDELAAQLLEQDTLLQRQLDEKRGSDTAFAGDASAQLEFLYRRSPYFEPEYRRYPVYRLWKLP